jgi:hypothetical protein
MQRVFALSFALLLALILIGCESSDSNKSSQIRIVASEKVWPANFNEIAFKREESPHYSYAVRTTTNQSDFEITWDSFQLTRKKPQIDFDKNEILFLGVEESGSCPIELNTKDVKLSEQKITIKISGPDGPCTADATPRTFVIEIPKSKELKELTILESGTETTIPLKDQ